VCCCCSNRGDAAKKKTGATGLTGETGATGLTGETGAIRGARFPLLSEKKLKAVFGDGNKKNVDIAFKNVMRAAPVCLLLLLLAGATALTLLRQGRLSARRDEDRRRGSVRARTHRCRRRRRSGGNARLTALAL
jgi:hypothetical protein